MPKESKPAPVATGKVRVEILHETFVPTEKGPHQKVLAGSEIDLSEPDATHLIMHGFAKAKAA